MRKLLTDLETGSASHSGFQRVMEVMVASETVRVAVAHAVSLGICFNVAVVEASLRIGGIGVSGGSEEQDEACARAGLAAIGLS